MVKNRSDELVLLQAKIQRGLRDEFMKAVKKSDDSASRLIRLWVRDYLRVAEERSVQGNLFDGIHNQDEERRT